MDPLNKAVLRLHHGDTLTVTTVTSWVVFLLSCVPSIGRNKARLDVTGQCDMIVLNNTTSVRHTIEKRASQRKTTSLKNNPATHE